MEFYNMPALSKLICIHLFHNIMNKLYMLTSIIAELYHIVQTIY